MRLAARFPIKPYPALLAATLGLHLILVLLAFIYLPNGWQPWLITGVSLFTGYFGWRQYRQLTRAPDDLCWTGENWLVQINDPLPRQQYLNLLGQSWVSSFACILHFRAETRTYAWLFTRSKLGDRAYSELCYLVKLDSQQSLKANPHTPARDWINRVWKR